MQLFKTQGYQEPMHAPTLRGASAASRGAVVFGMKYARGERVDRESRERDIARVPVARVRPPSLLDVLASFDRAA